MKKTITILLAIILVVSIIPRPVSAEGEPSFYFELSVDGGDTKEVQTGDIITVVLHLKRTDASASYTMYAMQDEIRYDSNFFELVEGSEVLSEGIVTTDIGMRDNYREFYMNYLSTRGGDNWGEDTLIGSFQLRVIATSGVTKITNEDYLVSTQNGYSGYACEGNELTIILSTECTVRFESNGGSEVEDQTVRYGEKAVQPENPTREGYMFDGWYRDIDQTEQWNFESDEVTGNMTLFAKWRVDLAGPPSETSDNQSYYWWIALAVIVLILLLILLIPRKRVIFNTMGGSEIKSKWIRKNAKLKEPENPRMRRKVFSGWYRDPECTISWNFEQDKVTEDVTLYAKWL